MMSDRRKDRRVWFLALGIFSAVFLFSFLAQRFKGLDESAEAASLENFDPGYIISDYQMGNYNSMSEVEIQAFLTKKNPCLNRDQSYYQRLSANNPGIKWHFSDGHFICLSEELFGDGEVIGSGETAAHIIWQAAQDYKINPQVLIVLLQKESGLITDPIPNNIDYRTATGYGCPDTAPCSSEYFGLKNQIRKAASLFRTVLDGGWTNYPLGENYIQYNPNSGCGGSVVNIRSLATSALYRYTPYQPNAGALAAGYGSAYCGAYGNRNFYLYFEDWFGGVREEMKWIKMDTPRYMVLNVDIYNHDLKYKEKGAVDFYVEKAFNISGQMCLRTQKEANLKSSICVPYENLGEMTWEFRNMDTPRYLESSNISKIIDVTSMQEIGSPDKYEFYNKKVFLPDGRMCLRAEKYEDDICVIYDFLNEAEFEAFNMETPRFLAPKYDGVKIVDVVKKADVGRVDLGNIFFNKKLITPDNRVCLLMDGGSSDYQCVMYDDLTETWVDMERPRELKMKESSYKIDANDLTTDRAIWLPVGTQRMFVSKRYLADGSWCLRTEFDFEKGTDKCIRFYELEEV